MVHASSDEQRPAHSDLPISAESHGLHQPVGGGIDSARLLSTEREEGV